MNQQLGLVTLLALVGGTAPQVSAQVLTPPGSAKGYALRQVASYGWEDMVSSPGMTPTDERAVGGVLARIADLTMDIHATELYVLDGEFKKVVVFRLDGSFKRAILGGYGKGPGEFVRPRSIAFVFPEEFAVLDQGNARVSFFSSHGSFVRSFNVPYAQPLQIVAHNDIIYLRRAAQRGRPAVIHLRTTGATIDSSFVIDDRNAQFTEYGELGRLAMDGSGNVIYAHPTVGRWSVLTADTWGVPRGIDLFPKERGRVQKVRGVEVRMAYVSVRGFADLRDGTKLLLAGSFGQLPQDPNKAVEQRAYLMVFGAKGEYRGYLQLPEGHTGPMSVGPGEADFFIAVTDPFPRVIRYSLTRGAQ
jgi:hypothetical protein